MGLGNLFRQHSDFPNYDIQARDCSNLTFVELGLLGLTASQLPQSLPGQPRHYEPTLKDLSDFDELLNPHP